MVDADVVPVVSSEGKGMGGWKFAKDHLGILYNSPGRIMMTDREQLNICLS